MLSMESYLEQQSLWPMAGRHILAQFDQESIIVYQAFGPQIAEEAATLGRFGPSFSRGRMSWIKPNFLWMMYRCGWATKPGQEHVLAISMSREFFERVLCAAIPSSFTPDLFTSRENWQLAVNHSNVRLQWDPDHGPSGQPLERRAIQLGLRGALLAEYADNAILEIQDITDMIIRERDHAHRPYNLLQLPRERIFVPYGPNAAIAIGLDGLASAGAGANG
jgi:hypothetical protein